MKKIISMLLVLTMALALMAGCATKNDPTTGTDASNPVAEKTTAVEVLQKIWDSYNKNAGDEMKPPISGGNPEEPVMDAPGKVDVSNTDVLGFTLNLATDLHAKVDDAASMMHMMNANTFTVAAYHVVAGTDVKEFAATATDGIKKTQWICGFPEHLVVATVNGEYVITAYGATDLIEQFKNEIKAVYPEAVIAADESLM